jgi:hypothetical protein
MRCGAVLMTGDLNMARRPKQHFSRNIENLHTMTILVFTAVFGSLTLVQPPLWQIVFIVTSLSIIILD